MADAVSDFALYPIRSESAEIRFLIGIVLFDRLEETDYRPSNNVAFVYLAWEMDSHSARNLFRQLQVLEHDGIFGSVITLLPVPFPKSSFVLALNVFFSVAPHGVCPWVTALLAHCTTAMS